MELNPEHIRILLCGVGIVIYLILKVIMSEGALDKFANTVIVMEVVYLCFAIYTDSYGSIVLEPVAIGIMVSHILKDGKKEKEKRERLES